MDFTNRAPQSPATPPSNVPFNRPSSDSSAPAGKVSSSPNKHNERNRWANGLVGLLVALILVLLVALVAAIGFGTPQTEGNYVAQKKLQAVFLTNGQVYFGNIKTVNTSYIDLQNIYYLQPAATTATNNTSTTPSNFTLIKLGCEVHSPYDEMVINRDQVTFWENLQDSGKVAQLIKQSQTQQGSDGLKCSDQSQAPNGTGVQGTNSGSSSSSSSTGANGSSSSSSTPAPTNSTKKP